MSRALRRLMLGAVVATVALLGPEVALAAPWCGSVGTADRPAVTPGHTVHVHYVYPSDGADRSAEVAPRIWADVEEIDAWWRASDPARTVNFDLTRFPCGNQVDLVTRRSGLSAAELTPVAGRFDRMLEDVFLRGRFPTSFSKYLVYYDGPVESPTTCGMGAGITGGTGLAVVFLQACTNLSTALVGAHELIHAFGALRNVPAPNVCPGDTGHVCDATNDILYPTAQPLPLASFVLDVGRNDYYGHSSPWFDVQDSPWLRHLDASTRFSLVVRGRGTVRSDVPGIACSASCATAWNPNVAVRLTAEPAAGQRFVRWVGGCENLNMICDLLLDAPQSLTAVFAPARYRLAVQVAGRGRVIGGGLSCAVARCSRELTSHRPVTLRATPAKGWRLRGWTGSCRGARVSCVVPMTNATSVRATFVRVASART